MMMVVVIVVQRQADSLYTSLINSSMKFSYDLKKLCGSVYNNGNILFSPDGNVVYSPVGNRLTAWDLVNQSTSTLPFETRKNIKRIEISHSGR